MSFPNFQRPKELSLERAIKNYENPKSVIHLTSPEFSRLVLDLPDHFVDITEEELEKINPDPLDSSLKLRILFWNEYDRATENNMLMDMTRVYTGVMTRAAFYGHIKNPKFLAWIVNPPTDYLLQNELLLQKGFKRIDEILRLPLKTEGGYIDSKLIDSIAKITMMIDMRLKGGYIHRSMQLTHNVNETTNKLIKVDQVKEEGELSLDEKIKMLEEKLAENVTPKLDAAKYLKNSQKNAIEVEYNESKEEK